MKKVRIGLFLFSIFRFLSPIALFIRILLYKYICTQNKRYGLFSISLILFLLIKKYWNQHLASKFPVTQKAFVHDFFLATQYMIFSIRFVVQRAEDFHQCKPIRKAVPRKTKRQGFHSYRLTFIFSRHKLHDCRRAFSLLESAHQIALPMRIHAR